MCVYIYIYYVSCGERIYRIRLTDVVYEIKNNIISTYAAMCTASYNIINGFLLIKKKLMYRYDDVRLLLLCIHCTHIVPIAIGLSDDSHSAVYRYKRNSVGLVISSYYILAYYISIRHSTG